MSTHSNMPPLNNKYFIMRHGESEANAAGLITSSPADCIAHYGLTRRGRAQVASSIKQAMQKWSINNETIILSSDFKRALETAETVREILGVDAIHVAKELRERFFGTYDGKHIRAYIEIWAQDHHDKEELQKNGVETPEHILSRLQKLIENLEKQYRNKCLLLVSHGDPLQVLQAFFAGLGPQQSHILPYIEPAEIRKLTSA